MLILILKLHLYSVLSRSGWITTHLLTVKGWKAELT